MSTLFQILLMLVTPIGALATLWFVNWHAKRNPPKRVPVEPKLDLRSSPLKGKYTFKKFYAGHDPRTGASSYRGLRRLASKSDPSS